jgi:CHAT domain-containing protein/tetratricopeptide (TPR) repeat protein
VRIRRDELFAEANRTAGSRRAQRLDRALSVVHPTLARADYQDWIAEITSGEGDQAAELKAKYSSARAPAGFLGENPAAPGTQGATPSQAKRGAEAGELAQRALIQFRGGEVDKAVQTAEEAWQIRATILGPYHVDTVASENDLAGLHFYRGNLDRAEQLFWEALAVSMAISRDRGPQSLLGITSLGQLYTVKGNYERAEAAMRLATELSRDNLDVAANSQSDQQQLAMTKSLRHRLDGCLAIAARTETYQESAYEQLLAWKGTVLARQQAVRSVTDQPELAPLFSDLQKVAAELAKVAFATPDPSAIRAWQGQIQALSERKEGIERQLAEKSATYRQARRRVMPAELSAALPAGYALVDCAEFSDRVVDSRPPGWLYARRRLLAFIVRPDRGLRAVDLGSVGSIMTAISRWREGFGNSAESAAAAQQLRELVWEPLEQHLEGAATVLVSPEGVLARVPFAAFPGKEPGKFLLEERAFAVIPAPQAVPAFVADAGERKLEAAANMLVLGGVDYDADLREAAVDPAAEPKKQFGRARAVRGDESLRFENLAATGGELATIALTYRDNYGDRGITTLKGATASETTLRREAPRHLYLHLATHGFFAPAKVRSALSGESGYLPGLLSGIALAGANKPQAEGDDGILTAAEVETLDLRRTELAVLSACETGLGEVAGGEGLLGLQRAFQVAGARTVIASLWKVDDAATRDLMERFYENLWSKKKPNGEPYTKIEALREAQLWMLKERGPRGLKEAGTEDGGQRTGSNRLPPYFWAAFVLSGDWR